ncbi:uncharacterized protein LOC143461631 isoform X2 [Clavelina lepadiformis]
MQQRRSPLQPVHEQVTSKDTNIRVKNECILFSQSIMSGRWNPASNVQAVEPSTTSQEGPEPRILSKKRRDLINAEIRELQNLLPLKKSARERLSYLGILALTNTFIRKATFFKKECISCDSSMSCGLVPEFSSSLCGFLLVFNRDGKILYSSDNILDYLGNTVVELASQGDSIYDFVDKEDHDQIRAQLDVPPHDDRGEARRLSFFCRMSTSRYMKTQMRSWKNKIVHVTGRYHRPEMSNDWSDTVFFAVCTPIESKPVTDVRHHPSPRATEFKAVHGPDMKFLEVPNTVESLLGYKPEELEKTSWYQWIYPEDVEQARQQHLKFVKEDGSAFACVLRMVKKDGSTVWVDITAEKSQESVGNSFICNYIVIDESEVPYFRIHHNLLPFPEHYTESQRQYLAYRSTLLSAALNSDVTSATTSPMTSPIGHPDPTHFQMSQSVFADNLDTKSILRRELMKRKMSSVESPIGVFHGTPYGPEVFAMPPNKMLIRSTSEMPYATPAYHSPLQHSTSFPEASYHPHLLYRHPAEESFMSQLHSPTTNPTGYLYDGGYTTLTPVRPHTLTLRPTQCSPVPTAGSSSPVNGHANQHNQNNNAHLPQKDSYNSRSFRGYSNQYSPAHSTGTPSHEVEYYQQSGSPCSQVTHSPRSPVQQRQLPAARINKVVPRPSVDGLLRDVSEIIDGELVCENSTTMCGSMTSSPAPVQQQCSVGSPYSNNNNVHSPVSCQHSPQHSPIARSDCNISSPNISLWDHQSMQHQSMGSPQTANSQCNSPVYAGYNYNPGCDASPRGSPVYRQQQAYPTSSCSQVDAANFQSRPIEKPYHVQYAISSGHPSTMKQYQAAAAAFYAATQQGHRAEMVEGGPEWMKKYGNMSAMEMLFSEAEGSPYLA